VARGGAAEESRVGFPRPPPFASITHGLRNGVDRFPGEIERLLDVGQANLRDLRADVERYGIDCALEPTGLLELATQRHEVAHLRESFELAERYGQAARWLDTDAARAEVDSPTYLAGLFQPDEGVMVHPARLAWGLRQAALERGVQIFERTPATDLSAGGAELLARTPLGEVVARKVLLATNAFPPLLRAIRRYVVPVYDYALMTEPLSSEQLAAIGWGGRQGIFDAGNQFHYYRLTADNRMLWGGYDAIYH
jgi:glycine/D-amino acid oxidase-like deaminating enzyme